MSESTDTPMPRRVLTTAAALGSFRKELLELGFTEGTADQLVSQTINHVLVDGLAVRDSA